MNMNFFAPAFTQVKSAKKQIAITFDDGPSPETEQVLNILKKYDVSASFFCIGKQIEKYPKIIERMFSEGHTIGNHSYSHKNTFPLLSERKIIEEIEKTNALITAITGKRSCLFRPPFGVTNPAIARAVKKTGQFIIGWNLRSFDTVTKDPKRLISRINSKIKAGSILLLHDNRAGTAEILEEIISHTKREGFEHVDIKRIFDLEELC